MFILLTNTISKSKKYKCSTYQQTQIIEQGKQTLKKDVEARPEKDWDADCWTWSSLCPLQLQATNTTTNILFKVQTMLYKISLGTR